MGFHENLTVLLKDRNLTQAELCRQTGVQTSLMSEYLSGKKSPTIRNAALIADALSITLDALIGRDRLPASRVDGNLAEAVRLFQSLRPEFQICALDQIKTLSLLQEKL